MVIKKETKIFTEERVVKPNESNKVTLCCCCCCSNGGKSTEQEK